jgi:hypothetical protein
MKAKRLRVLLGDGRLEDLGERITRGRNAQMGLGTEGGIGGMVDEEKMQSSESGAGWGATITVHFISWEERGKLYGRTKMYPCTRSQLKASKSGMPSLNLTERNS